MKLETEYRYSSKKDVYSESTIAVIGAACNYPGDCGNLDKFWDFLRGGGSAVSEVPADRWGREYFSTDPHLQGKSASRWGGFLPQPFPSGFDALFFDVS